ncbi:hypothetical protein D3C81_1532080 [compost metagenome]
MRCSLTRRNNSFSSGLEIKASIFFCNSPETTDDCLASSAKYAPKLVSLLRAMAVVRRTPLSIFAYQSEI